MLSVNHSLHCKSNGNLAPNFKCLDRLLKLYITVLSFFCWEYKHIICLIQNISSPKFQHPSLEQHSINYRVCSYQKQ